MRIQIPAGSIVLTPDEARILYQAADLGPVRSRYRIGDSRTYQILNEISIAAFSSNAADGNLPRQEAASEERRTWTVNQLARATRRAPRTVRLDIERKALPASKIGNSWAITAEHAKTYIASRRTN